MSQGVNHFLLTARIVERDALRYTPAGVPALNLLLEHDSEQQEASQSRQVKLSLKAIAFGALAEQVEKQAVGSMWRFAGFLASTPQGKSPVFHIQEFQSH